MIALSIYDDRIAPPPKWEFYDATELEAYTGKFACVETSYDQFPKAHCVPIEEYSDFDLGGGL